jgi:hypothetical protein
MKRITFAIAMCLAAGYACAGEETLATVSVNGKSIDCTPPTADAACEKLHAAIRANFSANEIGMLFGSATSRPGYLTSYSRVQERYAKFLRDVDTSETVASK